MKMDAQIKVMVAGKYKSKVGSKHQVLVDRLVEIGEEFLKE